MARKRFDPSQLGPIGPDVDLDEEEVYTADGRRLSEDLARQIGEEAIARHRGRPSVTGRPERSPNLTVRVATQTRDALEAIARAQGRRLADVSRDALDEYVKQHPVEGATGTSRELTHLLRIARRPTPLPAVTEALRRAARG